MPKGFPKSGVAKKRIYLTDEQVAEVKSIRIPNVAELAMKYNVCQSTIYRALGGIGARRKLTSEQEQELFERYTNGESRIELATRYCVGIGTVERTIERCQNRGLFTCGGGNRS